MGVKSKERLEDTVVSVERKSGASPKPRSLRLLIAGGAGWVGTGHASHISTPSRCHLLLVSIRDLQSSSAFKIIPDFKCILSSIQRRAPPVILAEIPPL